MKNRIVDIHTHILPGMDDGAADTRVSIAMLKMQAAQGVDTVVLTPHLYREREDVERFLERRARSMARLQAALDTLPQQERDALPKLVLGAEVAWRPNMKHMENLDQLCIEQTEYMLLELPNIKWTDEIINSIYNLLNRGITPVLAHLERYFSHQNRDMLEQLISIGVPFQISAGALSQLLTGRKLVRMLEEDENAVLASDCHGDSSRVPNMAQGVARLKKKLDEETVERILQRGVRLINP